MIAEFEAERRRNLGGIPCPYFHAQNQPLSLPPPPKELNSTEPSAEERRQGRKKYLGNTFAQDVLAALDLNFKQLEESHIRSNKPALDVGASYSTLAIEGTFRNIPIHSTDLRYNEVRYGLLSGIERRVSQLSEYYLNAEHLPSGFECYSIPETAWDECVKCGIALVDSRMVECEASKILLPGGRKAPERHFSTVVSHHAAPKYSLREEFLDKELPELLRVTDDRLHLFPFVTAGPGDPLLHVPGSEGRRSVEDIAARAGFSVEIKVSPTCIGGPKKEPGFNMLGIFVRRR